MKGLRGFIHSYAFPLFLAAIAYSALSGTALAVFCDIPPGVCTGQPYGFQFGVNCASAPTQCGSCECDGSGSEMCDLYDGANPCPTPTAAPTPTPAPGVSFTFTPGSGNFGDVAVGGLSTGFSVVVQNVSAISAASCNVYVTDDENFNIYNGACGTLAPGATCSVTVKANPMYTGGLATTLCIQCTGMPICPAAI